MHKELLRIAYELANRDVGHPRWVTRSRSVSTSYYALFHAVAEFCARELVGAFRPWPPFRHIYRSLDHGHAKRVFIDLRKTAAATPSALTLAEAFRELQEERHSADYDPEYRASRAEALEWANRARDAIGLIATLSLDERRMLAAKLIGRTRA